MPCKSRRSLRTHPGAILFLRFYGERVFQQPRLVTSTTTNPGCKIQGVDRLRLCCLLLCAACSCSAAFGQANEKICTTTSRPDCKEAVAFFDKLQNAVASNDRNAVSSMIRFPLRIQLEGHNALVKNKTELLGEYEKVFTAAVRCAITRAKRTEVWGNWQGFTVGGGVAWWEARAAPNSPFKVITVNNGSFYPGCSERK